MMPMMPHWGGTWGGFWWGSLFMIVFWLVIIAGAAFIIYALVSSAKPPAAEESPLEILRKRYARGEIDKEEFEEKKRDLI